MVTRPDVSMERLALHMSIYKRLYDHKGFPSLACLDCIHESGNTLLIPRINVPIQHRALGHGSALLRTVCLKADIWNVTLMLEVYATGSLDNKALVEWYHRYGFVRYGSERVMIRER